MPLHTELTKRFHLRYPIVSSPMGAVAGGRLAAAVSRAGGLGLIGPGYHGADWVDAQFQAAEDARVGVGFITWDLQRAPERLVSAGGDTTVRTHVFDIVRGLPWPSEFTGRALRNAFTDRWHGQETQLRAALPDEQRRYLDAASAGDWATAVLWAGEGLDLVREVLPAATIIQHLMHEAEATLRMLGRQAQDESP